MIGFFRTLFAPPSRWRFCHVPTPAEREAQWEIRRGHYRAEQALKRARANQALDARHIARPNVRPKLPRDRKSRKRK